MKKSEIGEACGTCRTYDRCIEDFRGKYDGKSQLGRLRRRCEDNIKMDLKELGWGVV